MSIVSIDFKYDFGTTVYLKTDKEQCMRIVSGYKLRPGGAILYVLSYYQNETDHYDFEISDEKDQVLTFT